jgi:hypothetical protein
MKRKIFSFFLLCLITIYLSACAPRWEITLISSEEAPVSITNSDIKFYVDKSTEDLKAIPLGQVLYASGYTLVDRIALTMDDGSTELFDWPLIAPSATISTDGTVTVSEKELRPKSIHVHIVKHLPLPQYTIMDIAPTIAKALGLPDLPNAMGTNRFEGTVERGVMILLDGAQYAKLMELVERGDLPFFLRHKNDIQIGLTVYPPISTSASAAFLTSALPLKNGVFGYGYRTTDLMTLFDLAAQSGNSVIAIEGDSLPFNLRNAEVTLSGDRDGNGFSDDNVYQNSLDVIETRMPDLLYIHFHDIDNMGHRFGPDSPEYAQALIRVDSFLSDIYTKLPDNTLIAIFADHGMHTTEKGGNHGTLTSQDMIIPIIFIKK